MRSTSISRTRRPTSMSPAATSSANGASVPSAGRSRLLRITLNTQRPRHHRLGDERTSEERRDHREPIERGLGDFHGRQAYRGRGLHHSRGPGMLAACVHRGRPGARLNPGRRFRPTILRRSARRGCAAIRRPGPATSKAARPDVLGRRSPTYRRDRCSSSMKRRPAR
jgi:hypothetical protein